MVDNPSVRRDVLCHFALMDVIMDDTFRFIKKVKIFFFNVLPSSLEQTARRRIQTKYCICFHKNHKLRDDSSLDGRRQVKQNRRINLLLIFNFLFCFRYPHFLTVLLTGKMFFGKQLLGKMLFGKQQLGNMLFGRILKLCI